MSEHDRIREAEALLVEAIAAGALLPLPPGEKSSVLGPVARARELLRTLAGDCLPPDVAAAPDDAEGPVGAAWGKWVPIVAPGGVLNLELVKRELYDYAMLLDNVPRVYSHATGGRVSKPNTDAGAVIAEIDSYIDELVEEEIADRGGSPDGSPDSG